MMRSDLDLGRSDRACKSIQTDREIDAASSQYKSWTEVVALNKIGVLDENKSVLPSTLFTAGG